MEHITRNWKKKSSIGGEITVMIALREAWGRLVLCNTASKVSGPVPKQTVLWSRCLCRSREGGGVPLAPFCFLADGTKISKCQVGGSLLLPHVWGEVFVTSSLAVCFGKVACPGEGKGASSWWGGWGDGARGRDVSLSIAPRSGELQAQCSEHERQRA